MIWERLFASKRKNRKILRDFKKNESVFHEILVPEEHYVGEEYLLYIAPKISALTGADYVMIGVCHPESNEVESLVNCKGTQILPNVRDRLSQLPSIDFARKRACSQAKGAWENFSFVAAGKDLIEGYVGVPLFSSSRKANGFVLALYRNAITEDIQTIESLLFLFTSRISSEIEHLQAREEINKHNAALQLMHRALKDRNVKLDESLEELRKVQLKSKEYDQLKSTFLANLSHEIRTPMNVILGFLELLKSDSLTPEERVEYVDLVNVNGLQLLKVMDNLIDISKLQTRVMQGQPGKFMLNELLNDLKSQYKKEAVLIRKRLDIELHRGLDDGDDLIVTDKDGLLKVLGHLLDNALKFTKEGGRIDFGYSVNDERLTFFVRDNGIGVPDGQEEVIFDMFRQSNSQLSREFGGNGLGLAISKKYVETLGGEIWLDKSSENGACFCFFLSRKRAMVNHSGGTVGVC